MRSDDALESAIEEAVGEMSEAPFVSVIVPCRNEAKHIGSVLRSVLESDHPREKLEVMFVDGMSVDGTREILERAARDYPFIRVLDNPRITTPVAMNIGIKSSRGDFIVRMDAHSHFPKDYIRRCVELLQTTGAGCAGGFSFTLPNGDDPWARAVAAATMHPLVVGNSLYRISRTPGFVDTVPFGAFPRAVLEKVGLFDERLTRNQDNELAARIRKSGYKIAFDPAIRLRYWDQATLRGLARQGFHTGMWNVYTIALHPYTWKARYFIPGAFALYLLLVAVCAAVRLRGLELALAPLLVYGALVGVVSLTRGNSGGGSLRVATTVISYHLAYGIGTLVGGANLLTGRWRAHLGRPIMR